MVLYNVTTPGERDSVLEITARKDRSGGVLIISLCPGEGDLARYRRAELPVVLIDMDGGDGWASVTVDNVQGGRLATEYLLELGHRRIAYLGATESFDFGDWVPGADHDPPNLPLSYRGNGAVSASAERRAGYESALASAGLDGARALVKLGAHSAGAAEQLTDELLDLDHPPTAIFASADIQAIGVIEAARRRGLRVPEDLSVLGFDDLRVARYMGLSTVRQPLYESGAVGARHLLRLLDGETTSQREVLPLEIVERRTTAKPPDAG